MPIGDPNTNGDGLQVTQTVQAATTGQNFRQMTGSVLQWAPELPVTMAEEFIRNSYRTILDARNWYGAKVKGILAVPAMVNGGQATVTTGSETVVGTNTNWDATLIGRQFRLGLGMPTYTIVGVPDAVTLRLELPWGARALGPVGYQIVAQLVSFGANVKRLKSVLNQQMGWPLQLDMPKAAIDAHDVWRATVGWTTIAVSAQQAPDGTPRWELYPVPSAAQTFPFEAYIQPPDLSDDNPFPVAGIRSDVIVLGALPSALLFRSRTSKYSDPQTATWKQREFMVELEKMKAKDDDYDLQSYSWDFNRASKSMGSGSTYAQEHDCEA